jgi:hypothetical protein
MLLETLPMGRLRRPMPLLDRDVGEVLIVENGKFTIASQDLRLHLLREFSADYPVLYGAARAPQILDIASIEPGHGFPDGSL